MPRYELEQVGKAAFDGVVRARDAEDAVRRYGRVSSDEQVQLEPEDEFQGWMTVRVNGDPSGRIRPHDRMRFRRD